MRRQLMKKCWTCGKDFEEGSYLSLQFCSKFYHDTYRDNSINKYKKFQQEKLNSQTSVKINCFNCGREVEKTDEFCINCDIRLIKDSFWKKVWNFWKSLSFIQGQ